MYTLKIVTCLLAITCGTRSFCQSDSNAKRNLSMDKVLSEGKEYNVIKSLEGKWNVEMKMWNDSSDKPIMIGNFVAERTMQGHFLEEVMQPAAASNDKPFKRIIYLNYNYANYRWEYIVLDTRYPLMMFETSTGNETNSKQINLYLPAFIMPPGWIDKNGGQLTKQRRVIDLVSNDKTVMKQYWAIPGGKEFLAVEYSYTRLK